MYIYIYIYIYIHELELAPVYMERLSRPAMTSPDHRVRVIHLTGLSSLAAALSSIGYVSLIYTDLFTHRNWNHQVTYLGFLPCSAAHGFSPRLA